MDAAPGEDRLYADARLGPAPLPSGSVRSDPSRCTLFRDRAGMDAHGFVAGSPPWAVSVRSPRTVETDCPVLMADPAADAGVSHLLDFMLMHPVSGTARPAVVLVPGLIVASGDQHLLGCLV